MGSPMIKNIHIIDSDSRRRAQVAHELGRNFHAEIYETLEEFFGSDPLEGIILASDEETSLPLSGSQPTALPVVVYAERPSTQDVVKALHSGALDYLEWPVSAEQFDAMLQRANRQGRSAQLQQQSLAKQVIAKLTRRERDVLLEVVNGSSNKQAGENLGISSRTVEIHRANLKRKLNARSAAALVRIALLGGLEDEITQAA